MFKTEVRFWSWLFFNHDWISCIWNKLRRIGVPIRGSLSRRLPNHWYLSRVEAQYWKPKIVVAWIPISSLIWICPYTNMLTRSNTWPLFAMLFEPKYYQISKLFSNSDTMSNYSTKFDLKQIKFTDFFFSPQSKTVRLVIQKKSLSRCVAVSSASNVDSSLTKHVTW